MAIDMTPEQRTAGEANFKKVVDHLGVNRRDFLKTGVLGAGAVGGTAAAMYFGYQSVQGNPVKTALIGGGDEGGVLVGEHNPDFLQFVAVCDIRPSNMRRIFEGDPKVPLRKGFKKVYGSGCDTKGIGTNYIDKYKTFDALKDRLRQDQEIEAVVIALPLHLHAAVAVECMQIGKERGKPIHVLSEKLMAWNIKQCKQMIQTAKETGSILSIGHQRHYSMIYAHALEVVKSGVLGDIKHIRALWHRNFTWPYSHDAKLGKQVPGITPPYYRDGWFPPVMEEDYGALKDSVKKFGYDSVEQLIRWRLYAETGGGLMAELGSHQLDASSIFLGKVHPLAVQGFGGKLFFGPGKNDRNIDDHVFVTYEFPGKTHPKNPHRKESDPVDENDLVVMTYSSVSTNSFEQYGECLMGSRGTMIVEAEQRVMLYTEKDPTKKGDPRTMEVNVATLKKDAAVADSTSTWGGPAASVSAAKTSAAAGGPVSRGYREEMEDFAYCVRMWDAKLGYAQKDGKYVQRLPRCHGEVAMADAIVALTANRAMREKKRIEFAKNWFDASSPEVPDDPSAKPKVEVKMG
jgi:predicted dehydrogenase